MTEIPASGGAFLPQFPSKHGTGLSLMMSMHCKKRYHPINVLLPLGSALSEDNSTLAHSIISITAFSSEQRLQGKPGNSAIFIPRASLTHQGRDLGKTL